MELSIHKPKVVMPITRKISLTFSVQKCLDEYHQKVSLTTPQIKSLQAERYALDISGRNPEKWLDVQLDWRLERDIQKLLIEQTMPAIEIETAAARSLRQLRQFLVAQFTDLSPEQRLEWLKIITSFLVTPDIRGIYETLTTMANYDQPLGQQGAYLLCGKPKMGKTSSLLYFVLANPPYQAEDHNVMPAAMFEAAPFENTKKALAHKLIEGAKGLYNEEEKEEPLFDRAAAAYRNAQTRVLIGDETANLSPYEMARRFIYFSNRLSCFMVCSTSDPGKFRSHDTQTHDRFDPPHELKPYTGKRLKALLAYLEVLLPFPEESGLRLFEISLKNRSTPVEGPAKLIEKWTGGILGDILKLVRISSEIAIKETENSRLTVHELTIGAQRMGLK